MQRIVITGGHLTPALAVIKKLPKEDWQILFIGRKYALEGESSISVECQTITKLGIPFISLTTGRLQRSLTRYTLLSLFKVPIGFTQSLYYLLRNRPAIILSFGGYVALPIVMAGWVLRIPVVTHEQSLVPGLATKIISKFAQKICVSWPETLPYFPKEKTILTGNPIREEIFKINKLSSLKDQVSNEDLPLLYITGGNLGAHTINKVVAEVLPQLLEKYRIIHQCGDSQVYKDDENLSSLISHLSSNLRSRYCLTKYVDSADIGWVLNNADLVVSRAGANIVSELLVLGKPAILIPLPWAGQNEQLANAQVLAKAGMAVILTQDALSGQRLLERLEFLQKNLTKFKTRASQAQSLVESQASQNIVKIMSGILNEKAMA